jgi:hypothetical protein
MTVEPPDSPAEASERELGLVETQDMLDIEVETVTDRQRK